MTGLKQQIYKSYIWKVMLPHRKRFFSNALNKTIEEIKTLLKKPDEGFVKRKDETWEECALRWFKNWDILGVNVLTLLDSRESGSPEPQGQGRFHGIVSSTTSAPQDKGGKG